MCDPPARAIGGYCCLFVKDAHREGRGAHRDEPMGESEPHSSDAAFDARMSEVVELRFFGGLTVEETADVLHISPETVMRDWKTAKAWLLRTLSGDPRP